MAETRLLPLGEPHVLAIARAMREEDRREVFATRFDEDVEALARDLVAASRFGAVVADGREPVAAMGAVECWPGMWSAWMIATDAWPRVARIATRWARIAVLRILAGAGAHRCECRSIEGHATAHRWLAHLGARAEAVHRGYGRNRENFITFAWRLDHVHVLGAEAEIPAAAAADRRCRHRGGRDRGAPPPRTGGRARLDAADRRRGRERTGADGQQDAARRVNAASGESGR